MFNKTLVSPIALAFGLALTGAAAAQTFVGEQEVSDAELPAVVEHCEALASTDGLDAGVEGEVGAETEDFTAEGEVQDDFAAEGEVEVGVDLDAITLEDCQLAGLVE